MNQLFLKNIYIYPIKSLGGINVNSANIEERGLQHDRRRQLVDNEDKFITQRKYPQMALLKTEINESHLIVSHKLKTIEKLKIPLNSKPGNKINTIIWNDICNASVYPPEINDWFSEALELSCRLVFMPDSTRRRVISGFSNGNEIVSFADAFPFLIIGESSLDFLNQKLKQPLKMNRFRPNFVFSGGEPHIEDTWKTIQIGNVNFELVKPCARCAITTVEQETGNKGKEPLTTLAEYRTFENKVLFGQNMVGDNTGKVTINDPILVREHK